MRSSLSIRMLVSGVGIAVGLGGAQVPVAAARPKPGVRPALNLFASAGLLYQVNRQQCGLTVRGNVCIAFSGSPVAGGGFWPKGTPDQYIFQSGLQIAAVIPDTAGGGTFPWAGDTVGAFLMDARGDQYDGAGLSAGVFDRLNPADAASWPNGAIVRDTAIYNPILIGDSSISQGDAWVRYWEGDPTFLSGRTHPMGLAVDQRALAWNYPSGNEDILYFVWTFYNVTAASSSMKYNNATIPAEIQSEIAALGDQFQALQKTKFGVTIPTAGYTLGSMYAAMAMDADVALFSTNYATAILPFNLGLEYAGNWLPPPNGGWVFPPDIFGAPFIAAPGFIGAKYLLSPKDASGKEVGLTLFSMTVNSATIFPDPVGVKQLYRYLSGFLGSGDGQCSFATYAIARARHICFLNQQQSDARFYQSSGPFDLPPGEARSIVVAYVNAAPTAAAAPFVNGDLAPGVPATGDSIFFDTTKVRTIERIAGWVTQKNADLDQSIEQNEVTTVPRSLLAKALVAQAVFDKGFLLPSSPTAPTFFLVPGDNRVTVVWQKSGTESVGDPFYAIASKDSVVDPKTGLKAPNALFDPNFRQFDVEGYRIYRGRTKSDLQLVAQFDYAGTSITDYTGFFDYTGDLNGDGLSQCAPELGLQADCPVTFDTVPKVPTSPHVDHDLAGNVVQVPPGSRVELANKNVFILKADTAVISTHCPTTSTTACPALTNTGVPFAYVDRSVRNSFTYYYAVTAFDVNSVKSGPTSLESPTVAKAIVPHRSSGQEAGASITAPQLLGAAGQLLNPNVTPPQPDAATGIFPGPMPPTDGFVTSLAAFIPQLIVGGTVTVSVDSVVPGNSATPGVATTTPAIYYVTGAGPTGATHITLPVQYDFASSDATTERFLPVVALDSAKAVPFQGSKAYSLYASVDVSAPGTWRLTGWGRGQANSDPANSSENGPRWWNGSANENTPNPNSVICAPSTGACVDSTFVSTPAPGHVDSIGGYGYKRSGDLNAGRLINPANDTVKLFHVQAYSTVQSSPQRDLEGITSGVTRAADMQVYWGTAGKVDSVIDVTHHIPVPFSTKIRASWGILNDSSFTNTTQSLTRDANNGLLTWSDIFCVDPVPTLLSPPFGVATRCGGTAQTPAFFMDHAKLTPISIRGVLFANTATVAATGNGFIFYLNGHFFLMQMAVLPPSGTVWHARFYAGAVTGSKAGADYAFSSSIRPPAVPGLRAQFTFTGSTFNPKVTNDSLLARVHTVPDPYYVSNALEITANQKILKFVNVPAQCLIRIYSVSGILVTIIPVNDPTGSGEATWNLRNRNNQFVASGVYFYHIETADGKTKVGRFTVVNFAP